MRARCEARLSDWTAEQACVPGAVTGAGLGGGLASLPLRALVRMVAGSLWSVLRAMFHR
jgi:hypothetical protein